MTHLPHRHYSNVHLSRWYNPHEKPFLAWLGTCSESSPRRPVPNGHYGWCRKRHSVDSKAETTKRVQTTSVGSLDFTLSLDAGGTNHWTLSQVRSSTEKLAREVPIVLASLLFAERQMGMINDPSRLAAVREMDEACRAAREGRLVAPIIPPNGRTVATYRVVLLANGGFSVNVEEKLAGVLSDGAGGKTAGALSTELLTTLREPYRTFYLEMLGAAVGFWRERRPSPIESTWVWKVALRRLDQLMRGGVE